VVHANHVLEHLPEPVATLRAVHRLLRPGGELVVEVPQDLTTPIMDRIWSRLHPGAFPPRQQTYHLVFFSAKGLRTAVRRAGFVVARLENVRHTQTIQSRFPLGAAMKKLVFWSERRLGNAPQLVMIARRPEGSALR
jgi:predicted SAM-dependent methyltransferase